MDEEDWEKENGEKARTEEENLEEGARVGGVITKKNLKKSE